MSRRWRACPSLVARVLVAGAVLLPACAASQEWIYEKPRVTPAQLEQDKTACRKMAPSRSMLRVLDEEKVDRDAFNRCMRGRGYTVKVAPLP